MASYKKWLFHAADGPSNLIFGPVISKDYVSRFTKGPYIKYVGGGLEGFCGGHEIF